MSAQPGNASLMTDNDPKSQRDMTDREENFSMSRAIKLGPVRPRKWQDPPDRTDSKTGHEQSDVEYQWSPGGIER